MSTVLDTVAEKVAQGQPLLPEEALALWESRDVVSLGMLADASRRRRHGDLTTWLRVAVVSLEQLPAAPVPEGAGEIRIAATAADLAARVDDVADFVARAGPTPVTAGALDDLEAQASEAKALTRLLQRLGGAGLYGIAEARVDGLLAPEATVDAAVGAGLAIARFTVARLPSSGPWELFARVQRIQGTTGAVRTFAPLPLEDEGPRPTTGYADVKLVALARLVLDDVSSIQVDWGRRGAKLAQVALLFGADDIDGVSVVERAADGRRRTPVEDVRRNIRAADLTPVERDGRFGSREA